MNAGMSTDQHALRLERINATGWEIAQRLAAVKSRQNMDLSDIKGAKRDDTDEPPEVRLRRFLDQINQSRQRLATDAYGKCTECGASFQPGQLDEMPWVELCAPCDAR